MLNKYYKIQIKKRKEKSKIFRGSKHNEQILLIKYL